MTQIEALTWAINKLDDFSGAFSEDDEVLEQFRKVKNKLSEIKQAFESKRRQQEMGRYKKQH